MPAWAVTPSCTYGTKARGLTYERKVGKYLTKLCDENGWKLWDHQWFLYAYGKERKYFQPDFLIERPSQEGIIVEVKLTYVDTTAQLQKYLEYLKIFGFTGFPLVIVRNLTPALPCAIIDDFANATPNAVLHLWL